ncbi:MAG: hypothetical protein LBF67_00105 [Prevotellaceae bacterium]|nr:hypothetical protein [Prevotellaceae bacterium]
MSRFTSLIIATQVSHRRSMWNVLKGRNFHNRRSTTCGGDSPHRLLPERQDFRDDGKQRVCAPQVVDLR